MIASHNTKILIVPDFGVNAEDEAMAALKRTIDEIPLFTAEIADLRKMVIDDHPGEELDEKTVIDLCARNLEQLASEKVFESVVPDLFVLFGRSAMLAGNVTEVPLLFINPIYDREWPWKKQYYANLAMADEIYEEFMEEVRDYPPAKEYCRERKEKVDRVWPPRLYLSSDAKDSEAVLNLYPGISMTNPELIDSEYLAGLIRDFVSEDMDMPLIDIYRMLQLPERGREGNPLTARFQSPVEIDRKKVIAIKDEANNKYRMPRILLQTDDDSDPIFFENVHDRHELAALRDEMEEAVMMMPTKKYILIVPGLLTPIDSLVITNLRRELEKYGHHVSVYVREQSLKLSREGLERRCRRGCFDLVVTLESGCLLASKLNRTPRIFINPNWKVWEEMKRTGSSREEWELARTMGDTDNFRRSGPHQYMGWFTIDMIDSEEAKEHMARFGEAAYPPHADLTTETGIRSLARQIHNMHDICTVG